MGTNSTPPPGTNTTGAPIPPKYPDPPQPASAEVKAAPTRDLPDLPVSADKLFELSQRPAGDVTGELARHVFDLTRLIAFLQSDLVLAFGDANKLRQELELVIVQRDEAIAEVTRLTGNNIALTKEVEDARLHNYVQLYGHVPTGDAGPLQ